MEDLTLLKSKKFLLGLLGAIVFALLAIFAFTGSSSTASADTSESENAYFVTNIDSGQSVHGLYTSLSLSLNGGDGKVWATVRNDVTLLPATVNVVVQLYCSDTYQEDYQEMELIAYNSITDLDMGKSIVAEASTGGKEMFWIGRMRYRVDSQSWKEDIVGPARCSANGDYLGLT